jgi:hypothetical protein
MDRRVPCAGRCGAALTAALSVATGATAQCPDAWGATGFPVGFDGAVTAAMVWDPDGAGPLPDGLVATGTFAQAGGVSVPRAAAWDGVRWGPLGDGYTGDVRALGSWSGRLVIGGALRAPSGAQDLAQLEGGRWMPVGPRLPGAVDGIAAPGGRLHVLAGGFVLRLDASGWALLPAPAWPGQVTSILDFNGELLIGGEFLGLPASVGVLRWANDAWVPLVADAAPYATRVYTLAVIDNQLYVGSTGGVHRYTGSAWVTMSAGLQDPNGPYAVLTVGGLNGTLVAAGYFEVEFQSGLAYWDGEAWRRFTAVQPQSPSTSASALPTFRGELMVAGGGFYAGVGVANGVAAWDGHTGHAVPQSPVTAFSSAEVNTLAPFNGELFAGGRLRLAEGGTIGAHVARWDGAGWHAVPGVPSPSDFDSVRALRQFGGRLYAGGFFGSGSLRNLVAWDGATWSAVGQVCTSVNALAEFQGRLFVGAGLPFCTPDSSTVAVWDGATLRPQPLQSGISSTVHCFLNEGGLLYAGGIIGNVGGSVCRGVAVWDGAAWRCVGGGPGGTVHALCVHQGTLYAGGHLGGLALWRLAGDTWERLPAGGAGATITSLCSRGDALLVGISGARPPQTALMVWGGSSLVPLAGGPEATDGATPFVGAMEPWGEAVMIGGHFGRAGTVLSSSVASLTSGSGCYANCDCSTGTPALNALDFTCFVARFGAGDPYANCDGSQWPPMLSVLDFNCFVNRFTAGCP